MMQIFMHCVITMSLPASRNFPEELRWKPEYAKYPIISGVSNHCRWKALGEKQKDTD